MRLLFFTFIVCVFLGNYSNAQDLSKKMEQENLDFLLHKILFDELIKSKDDTSYTALFNKFLSVELTIDTLKSKNFDCDIIFLSISDSLFYDDGRKVTLKNKNKFIVAVHAPGPWMFDEPLRVYRLSGFSASDFPYFRNLMKAVSRHYELCYERITPRRSEVEGLDLKLLTKSFRKFNVKKQLIRYPEFRIDQNILEKQIVVE